MILIFNLPSLFKVVEHIRSYEREVSHYAREKTKDREYLDSSLTIAEIWRQFRRKKEQEGVDDTLSYGSFRNIFRKFKLSFRKPYVDTCSLCDGYSIITKYAKDEDEKKDAQRLKSEHVEKADQHYDCINYDLKTFLKEKNIRNGHAWELPPIWKESRSNSNSASHA